MEKSKHESWNEHKFPKIKILSSFTHPHDFLYSTQHQRKSSEILELYDL